MDLKVSGIGCKAKKKMTNTNCLKHSVKQNKTRPAASQSDNRKQLSATKPKSNYIKSIHFSPVCLEDEIDVLLKPKQCNSAHWPNAIPTATRNYSGVKHLENSTEYEQWLDTRCLSFEFNTVADRELHSNTNGLKEKETNATAVKVLLRGDILGALNCLLPKLNLKPSDRDRSVPILDPHFSLFTNNLEPP